MKKPKVVITYPFHKEVIKDELKPFATVKLVTSRRDLEKEIATADALISLITDKVDRKLIDKGKKLQVIGNYAVGYDNIDIEACREREIPVVNTPDVLTRSTAEIGLTLLLAAARRATEGIEICRSTKSWKWKPDYLLGIELKGRTAVIVGPGRIGMETAGLYRALGMQIKTIHRNHTEPEITEFLKSAQVLSLHMPLHEKTHHWLNAKRLKKLPKDCIVINTARGPLIDEEALVQALKKRQIFAAGLDVYEFEPKIHPELKKLPNVVLLPHLGSATTHARRGMAEKVVRGVKSILSGQQPTNIVN